MARIDASHPLRELPHRRWQADDWRFYRWIYDRLLEDVDRQIATVLDAIDAHLPEALVISTSDHGEMNGAHRLTQKGVFYEEAIRVPLVARWPGRIPAGSRCAGPVSNGLDLLPTILAAAEAGKLATIPVASDWTCCLPGARALRCRSGSCRSNSPAAIASTTAVARSNATTTAP